MILAGVNIMTISIKEFVLKYEGKSIDFDKKYGAQCVDLFNYYNSEVVGAPFIGTPRTGGARDLFEVDSSVRSKFYKRLEANSQLQPGDVVIYGAPNGRARVGDLVVFLGHVRIYIGDNNFIEQNARNSGVTTVGSSKVNGMLGILRPLKFIGENSPQDVPPPANNKNKHVIQKGDTFWGLEEANGWTHGTLQNLNPDLDAKKLQIGSSIVIPTGEKSEVENETRYYTIKAGDNFWALENAWQLAHGTLQQLNPDIEAKSIPIGSRIRIS